MDNQPESAFVAYCDVRRRVDFGHADDGLVEVGQMRDVRGEYDYAGFRSVTHRELAFFAASGK